MGPRQRTKKEVAASPRRPPRLEGEDRTCHGQISRIAGGPSTPLGPPWAKPAEDPLDTPEQTTSQGTLDHGNLHAVEA